MTDIRLAVPAGAAATLTAEAVRAARSVAARCAQELDDHVAAILRLARIDSGVDAPDGIARVLDEAAAMLPGDACIRHTRAAGGRHLYARLPGNASRVLLLAHADTVSRPAWPRGARRA